MKTLKTITLSPTKGTKTIVQATDVFSGWIDSDFKDWNLDSKLDSKVIATKKMNVTIYEMTEDATFAQIFTQPEEMFLTQEQIVRFCKEHPDELQPNGFSTFFLFKENNNFFVADVRWDGRRLGVNVYRLSSVGVWDAVYRRRFVIKSQVSKKFN